MYIIFELFHSRATENSATTKNNGVAREICVDSYAFQCDFDGSCGENLRVFASKESQHPPCSNKLHTAPHLRCTCSFCPIRYTPHRRGRIHCDVPGGRVFAGNGKSGERCQRRKVRVRTENYICCVFENSTLERSSFRSIKRDNFESGIRTRCVISINFTDNIKVTNLVPLLTAQCFAGFRRSYIYVVNFPMLVSSLIRNIVLR